MNTVLADLLSFSGGTTRAGGKRHPIAFDNPSNDILTQRFHLYYLEQIPSNFEICLLPSEILSWVLSLLQTAASCLIVAKQKAARSPATGPGVAGSDFAPKLGETMTLSSINYPQSDKKSSFVPLLPALAQPNEKREKRRKIAGKHTITMVASTVREATSQQLAMALWNHLEPSPNAH